MFRVFQNLHALPIAPLTSTLAIVTLVVATTIWAMMKLSRASDIPTTLSRLDEPRRLALLAGALLLSGCFFAGQNVPYRGIFLFLVIPGLSALAQDRNAGAIASTARLMVTSIPFLMWAEALRLWLHLGITGTYPPPGFHATISFEQPWDFLAWFGREVGWWFFVGFLLTMLVSDLVVHPLKNGLRPLLRSMS